MSLDGFLNLDPETIRNLHIFPAARKSLMKSLFSTLNFCKTKMGGKKLSMYSRAVF